MTHPISITQAELQEISELERELTWKENHLEEMKANLLILLREGVPVEPGRFDARLATRVGRNVPWKVVLIERLGINVANEVKHQYKVHTWFEVEVIEHATRPLWLNGEDATGSENGK